MNYIDALRALENLSDEEIKFMYRDGSLYLTSKKPMFMTVYNQRLARDRIIYVEEDDYQNEEFDRGTTLSAEDLVYLTKQKELVSDDSSVIDLTQEEYIQLSTHMSYYRTMSVNQAKKYISSMSVIFAISMLGSVGIYKDLDLVYGTNPVVASPKSEAHVHLYELIGFLGICDVCLNTMSLEDTVRKPLIVGGWEGWFCSQDCMSQYVLDSGENEVELSIYMDMWKIISS